MREQACVIKQRVYGGFSVVTYSLAAFRYLMTGIVALLLALLLVLLIAELGAVIGAALEHVHENSHATRNFGGCVTGASAQAEEVLWRAGVEVSFVHPRADFGGSATLYPGATTRSVPPSASIIVRF
jgi:hypothetical protein